MRFVSRRVERGTRKYRALRALAAMGIAAALWAAMIYAVCVVDADIFRWRGHTPVVTYQMASVTVTNGVQINIGSITENVPWSDVKVQLTDGTNFAEWSPVTENLDGGSAIMSSNLTATLPNLGALSVYCSVFDYQANGFVNSWDYIRVSTETGQLGFSSATQYTLVLIYELNGVWMGSGIEFTG